MRKILYLIFAVIIAFLGYRIFFTSLPGKTNDLAGQTIICFGDSLTYGTGAGKEMDYPSQLSTMIAGPVINAGVPGDTTARALQRLERDVLAKSPDLVLLTLGGNDLKNGVARDVAFENLKRIVDSIQETRARVIIGGLWFPLRDRGFGRAYQELADETGAVLVPNIFEGIMGNGKLMSDPIHPNDAGYKIIAERFHEAILQL
ncbi:Acyl-CoA thioesterase I [Olavius sp. associated proteobacterium Delta 1]|nr:Acyl-CoA thioesterase I [Olavius sp. associated proteobacterium Delta 1]